jgi:hypothetical protein
MEIDLTSIIIGIIALSIFFVPIFYYEVYKKRASKKFDKYFTEVARSHDLTLSQHDTWRDRYAIGFDENAGKVIHLRKKNGQDETVLIDLSGIKKCRISKADDKIKTPKGVIKRTSRIDLSLAYRNASKTDKLLEFYRGESGDELRGEMALAEKWSRMISSRLGSSGNKK